VNDYPAAIAPLNHVEPVPRRVRAYLAGVPVIDTTRASYVWEWPYYPQFYIPRDDIAPGVLVEEDGTLHTSRGPVTVCGLRVGDTHRPRAGKLLTDSPIGELTGTVRFEWEALDAWFEEDEQVFVHPRNPYVRVDALRSTRTVRVELSGVVLAESSSPIMVVETGLPTRYYLNRTEVDFTHMEPSETVTSCPYKGTTGGYWSVKIGETLHRDLAWCYDFPTGPLLPIAGLVAFYNERVDLVLDGRSLPRPQTHFSRSES